MFFLRSYADGTCNLSQSFWTFNFRFDKDFLRCRFNRYNYCLEHIHRLLKRWISCVLFTFCARALNFNRSFVCDMNVAHGLTLQQIIVRPRPIKKGRKILVKILFLYGKSICFLEVTRENSRHEQIFVDQQ
jgi:hypothetical protein